MVKKSKTKVNPGIDEAWKLYNVGRFDDALKMFISLINTDSSNDALYGKACALFRINDFEGALADLSELIKKDEQNHRYLHSRALIYGANEQYDMATHDLERVSELYPDNVELLCDLGGTYLIIEEYNQASICFERAANLDKSCPCVWFGKGMVALSMNEPRKAGEYFNIVIKLDSKHTLAHMARAEVAFISGKKKDALKDIKKALTLDKDFYAEFKDSFELTEDAPDDSDEKPGQRKKPLDDEDAMEVY